MIKILVTGGSGFIGTNLMEFYLQKNIQVINLDLNPPIDQSQNNYWIPVDILDQKELEDKIIAFDPTHIIHLAAKTDLMGKTLEDYQINTTGTENIIGAALKLKNLKRIIFTSSMLVCKVGYIPLNEDDYNPVTIYGESKMIMEKNIRARKLPFQHIIIRPTSIWGPWFKTPYRDFFDMVSKKSFINILNRPCLKTYGFILNSVYQINELLFRDKIKNGVFYIGDRPALNIAEWADSIALKIHDRKPLRLPHFIFYLAAKTGDILKKIHIHFPITSFRLKNITTDNVIPLDDLYRATGPAPYSIDEGIDITLKWLDYKRN